MVKDSTVLVVAKHEARVVDLVVRVRSISSSWTEKRVKY